MSQFVKHVEHAFDDPPGDVAVRKHELRCVFHVLNDGKN
jgi:hypothetical protein